MLFTPTTLEKGLKTLFLSQMALSAKDSLIPRLASTVKSEARSEKYIWLGDAPMLDEFIDEFAEKGLLEASYELTNKKYGRLMVVKKDDIEDDQTGGIIMRVRQLAQNAVFHQNRLLIDTLIAGTTNTGYDATAFFSATHPARGDSGAQSNIVTGTGTTTAQVGADLNSAIVALMGLKSENGEAFHEDLGRLIVVAPWGLSKAFNENLNAQILSNSSNVAFAGFNISVVFTTRITDNDWYLLQDDGIVRPLLYQDRSPIEFTALDASNESDATFRKENYYYKVRYRGRFGYSFWQKAVKVNNS